MRARGRRVLGLCLVAGVLLWGATVAACGSEDETAWSGAADSLPSTETTPFAPVFVHLRDAVAPMLLYGLAVVPAGATVRQSGGRSSILTIQRRTMGGRAEPPSPAGRRC